MEDEDRPKATGFDVPPTNDEFNSLSVHELKARIAFLKAEIARTEEQLKAKDGALSAAESLFKS